MSKSLNYREFASYEIQVVGRHDNNKHAVIKKDHTNKGVDL